MHNLAYLNNQNLRDIALKDYGGLFGYGDIHPNISKREIGPHLQSYVYITTKTGFLNGTGVSTSPLLGIILPRVHTRWDDWISTFVLHDVEDIEDYNLRPEKNIRVKSKRELGKLESDLGPYASISNKSGLQTVFLNASYVDHQISTRHFLEERGYNFDSFFGSNEH